MTIKKTKKFYLWRLYDLLGWDDEHKMHRLKKLNKPDLIEICEKIEKKIQPINIEKFEDIINLNIEKHDLCYRCEFSRKTPFGMLWCRAQRRLVNARENFRNIEPIFEAIEYEEGNEFECHEISFCWGNCSIENMHLKRLRSIGRKGIALKSYKKEDAERIIRDRNQKWDRSGETIIIGCNKFLLKTKKTEDQKNKLMDLKSFF